MTERTENISHGDTETQRRPFLGVTLREPFFGVTLRETCLFCVSVSLWLISFSVFSSQL